MSYPTEPTRVLPGGDPAYEPTVNLSAADAQAYEEAQRQAYEARARQQAERQARDQALGAVPAPADDDVVPPKPRVADNDRVFASLGLVLFRLVVAAFIGVRGVQVLFDITGTKNWLGDRNVPMPELVTWLLAVVLLVCAAMIVVGFGTRVAGALIAALAIATLVYIRWGYMSVFVSGQPGFIGDTDLLVAGAGFALLCVGSGGWAVDAAMRRARARNKLYQQ